MRFIIAVCILLLGFAGTSTRISEELPLNTEPVTMKKTAAPGGPGNIFDLSVEDVSWVEEKLSRMTIYEKCAQMVMPWAEASFMSQEDARYRRLIRLVKDLKVGGLIFLEGDLFNQVVLTNELQSMSDIPLLISSDFERGIGMRLRDAIEFPYNMAVAAADDTALTYQMGRVIGMEARAIGVQQNYAPMGDINVNPDNPIINNRSFSEDKDLLTRHMLAFIKGSHDERILTTVKHFPGHGATDLDSHKDMPLISASRESLEQNELVPFREAINAGVKSVMIGHLNVPALCPEKPLPATLSKEIVTDLLKEKLGFTGLVVTDAMNMHGLTKYYKPGEATVRAIEAGNDIILFPPNEDAAIQALHRAVESGEISTDRIDYSVRKILAAKKWLQLDRGRYSTFADVSRIVNKRSHLRLAQEIADKSITLLKNEKDIIPLKTDKYKSPVSIVISDRNNPKPSYFQKRLKERFAGVAEYTLGRKSTKRDYANALRLAAKSDLVLLPMYVSVRSSSSSISLGIKQDAFVKELLNLQKPVVIMSMGNPYILSEFTGVPAYLCSYGEPEVSQDAMLKAVMGEINISGKLPVNIPGTGFKVGSGISLLKSGLRKEAAMEDSMYNFNEVDSVMISGLQKKVFPGAVLFVGQKSRIIYHKAFGKYTYDAEGQPMTEDAIFDLASVSKVIGTTTAAMILYDEGKLKLDRKVMEYLPEFGNHGKENITIRNLLLHNSGLPAFKSFYKTYTKPQEVISDIMVTELEYPTGTKSVYSDLGMITLQKVIENISGKPLDRYLQERVFTPLGMHHTVYKPADSLYKLVVPTEKDNYWRMMTLRGKVHDETAYLLGGVAGHAGLFSTAGDVSVFLQMLLNRGKYNGIQLIKSETVEMWTKRQSGLSSRALGWDTKAENGSSAGFLFSSASFGHTGYTGTSLWIDKKRELFVVLLTNRVYPTRENTQIIKFRPMLHDAVVRAVSYL